MFGLQHSFQKQTVGTMIMITLDKGRGYTHIHTHSVVKLGSPNLNLLIIVGATLLYLAMFFYATSVHSLAEQLTETVLCNVS